MLALAPLATALLLAASQAVQPPALDLKVEDAWVRWRAFVPGAPAAANPQADMMRAMYGQQPQPGANPQQQQMAQQQAMAQMMANPYLMAARMAAFDMSHALAVWGTSANDFYVTTGEGRNAADAQWYQVPRGQPLRGWPLTASHHLASARLNTTAH